MATYPPSKPTAATSSTRTERRAAATEGLTSPTQAESGTTEAAPENHSAAAAGNGSGVKSVNLNIILVPRY